MSADTNWILLSDLVHKTMKALEKKNIKDAEAFFTETQTSEVRISNSEIQTQNKADDSGVGFRVVVAGNKVGFACTNKLNQKAILEAGDKALAIAKVSNPVPDFALPKTGKLPKVKQLFDPQVANITVEQTVDLARRTIEAAEGFDKRVIAKYGRVIFESARRGILNTSGVDSQEEETRAVLYLGGSGKQNGEVTPSCADFAFTRIAKVEPEKIGENVARMVTEMFKPGPVESFMGTVIFGPESVSYQLADALIDALKGENVVTGRSAWTGRLGQTVASEDFTVEDNAVLEGGFASRSFDDEGCVSQRTMLIEKGILRSHLHHATSANALKAKNTGNASRFVGGLDMVRAIIGNGYKAKPEVYPSNLIICAGNKSKEELVSEVKKGVLVESMAGFTQAGSGLISAQLSRAFCIQNGEIQHPIRNAMVSGIAFTWLKNITGVGNDSKQFQNAVVPSVRVDDVKVIGA